MDEETKKGNVSEDEEAPDDDVKDIMEAHDLDKDEAEQVQELMDELGVDEDEAVEIMQEL